MLQQRQDSHSAHIGGIVIWIIAFYIGGISESFYGVSYELFKNSILFEESFESIGTILLFSSALDYLSDIGLDLMAERINNLAKYQNS